MLYLLAIVLLLTLALLRLAFEGEAHPPRRACPACQRPAERLELRPAALLTWRCPACGLVLLGPAGSSGLGGFFRGRRPGRQRRC